MSCPNLQTKTKLRNQKQVGVNAIKLFSIETKEKNKLERMAL